MLPFKIFGVGVKNDYYQTLQQAREKTDAKINKLINTPCGWTTVFKIRWSIHSKVVPFNFTLIVIFVQHFRHHLAAQLRTIHCSISSQFKG